MLDRLGLPSLRTGGPAAASASGVDVGGVAAVSADGVVLYSVSEVVQSAECKVGVKAGL
jgi:hypothetical protein